MTQKPSDPATATAHIFKDRTAAGEQLAGRLQSLLARPCVIAAIPRGGVAVALPIVERPETSGDCPCL